MEHLFAGKRATGKEVSGLGGYDGYGISYIAKSVTYTGMYMTLYHRQMRQHFFVTCPILLRTFLSFLIRPCRCQKCLDSGLRRTLSVLWRVTGLLSVYPCRIGVANWLYWNRYSNRNLIHILRSKQSETGRVSRISVEFERQDVSYYLHSISCVERNNVRNTEAYQAYRY